MSGFSRASPNASFRSYTKNIHIPKLINQTSSVPLALQNLLGKALLYYIIVPTLLLYTLSKVFKV